MHRFASFLVTVLVLLPPAPALPRLQQASATVEGFVVDSVTGQPIEGVHVAMMEGGQPITEEGVARLLRDQGPSVTMPQVLTIMPALVMGERTLLPARTSYSVMTDARGRFVFSGVAAGKYMIAFRIDGYTLQYYGQKSDSSFVPPADIHAGRNELGNVGIRPEPQISGRILDPAGAPIDGIPVYLLRAQPYVDVDGGKRFRIAGEAVTDATGTYLIKDIVGGRYYLAAGSFGRLESILVGRAPDGGRSQTRMPAQAPYPYTYYPGVPSITAAGQVDVPAGNRMISVGDMVVTKGELRSIRGRVVDNTTGNAPASVRVSLSGWSPFSGAEADRQILSGKYDSNTGEFEFINLIPGPYRVEAVLPRQPIAGQPRDALLADVTPQSAFELLELTNADVKDLVLTVPSGGRLTGKVLVFDGTPLPVAQTILPIPLQLHLRGLKPLQPEPVVTSVSVQDGTFEVASALEGKYRFYLTPLRDNYYVSEVRMDTVRIVNGILDIPKGVTTELFLTVSPGGEVPITALDQKGQPVAQARGVLLPDPLPDIIPFNQRLEADNAGRFTARNIPPGTYKIYMWDGADPPEVFDRDLLARSGRMAHPIRVEKGVNPGVTVKILER